MLVPAVIACKICICIAQLGVRFGINHPSNVVGMTVKLHETDGTEYEPKSLRTMLGALDTTFLLLQIEWS